MVFLLSFKFFTLRLELLVLNQLVLVSAVNLPDFGFEEFVLLADVLNLLDLVVHLLLKVLDIRLDHHQVIQEDAISL